MSGAPKRSHEESTHSSSSSKYPPHEDSPSFSKLPVDYIPPYEVGTPDARLPKIPRTDAVLIDRKILPPAMFHRLPTDSHVDTIPLASSASASEEPKDHHRFENRDARELYGDSRRDSQNAKGGEKDSRHDSGSSRGEDNKDTKYDRDSYNDAKSEVKNDKDSYGVPTSSHLNWKDSKEYNRGKRYSDAPPGSTDAWMSRGSSQGHAEAGKEPSTVEERDLVEAHEAVGENKFDLKGEDKFKDKDRKRKDVKHRDWGEREKERVDRRSNVQVADGKELTKEERDVERWERERKDPVKDKERVKEREKDHNRRESWNGADKESNEKDLGDGSNRLQEQENVISDNKKQKESESWKTVDKESRDRRKERDVDGDGDRTEKCSRAFEKESDDGCAADAEGGMEREREVYNYSVQQRKRMQRSRGSPQVVNREPRFRTRTQENEGSQGKAEVSSVVYKVGECMQELIKLWKEYEASQAEKNSESSSSGPTLEIRIPAEHVTATNRQVRGGQLWGTDIYTDDSDLVAVLMHTGYCRPTASPPPPAIQELRATICVLPPQDCYISTLRNNVRSRAWGAAIGCSYRVERCCIMKKGGGTIDLEPCLTHTSTVEPTLAPVAVERTMTTRAAASNALRQQRFVREVTIQYNLCNEPWIKYSISIVADKGLKKPLYTSARLKKGEVLYLETHSCRYELCFSGEKVLKAIQQSSHAHDSEAERLQNHHSHSANGECENVVVDGFRWSRCKTPLPQKVMRSVGIPLPLEHVEVLEENLEWEDVQWSQTGVWIAGKEYILARVHFLSMN